MSAKLGLANCGSQTSRMGRAIRNFDDHGEDIYHLQDMLTLARTRQCLINSAERDLPQAGSQKLGSKNGLLLCDFFAQPGKDLYTEHL